MNEKILGMFGILIGGSMLATFLYQIQPIPDSAIVFSPHTILLSLWRSYKTHFWEEKTGRVSDSNGLTTSEGQSYMLLRAVWLDDQVAFDTTWNWTRTYLARQGDALLSWKYGKRSDGKYGVLVDSGGENSASDADTDIALALLFAYSRWHESRYLSAAEALMGDIWKYEVVLVSGKPYLAADNIERLSPTRIIMNPSYFAPYAYRIFQYFDPRNDWNGLVDTSYAVIQKAASSPLDTSISVGLPPDWVMLDRRTGILFPSVSATVSLNSNYGYDAFRVSWRLALDWQWFGDSRAKDTLARFGFLSAEWKKNRVLKAVYDHEGSVISKYETPAGYAGAIGYFSVIDPPVAKEIYTSKLASLYSPDIGEWATPLSYYDDNWTWFGIGLYNSDLPNLARVEMTHAASPSYVL